MRLKPLILVAVATTGAASSAQGQTMPTVPVVAAKREMLFGVRAGVTYETNVAHANAAAAAARGLEQEDTSFRPQATVSIAQPVGQQMLFLQGSGGYDFYRRNTRLNRERIDVTGGGFARLLSCQETLFSGYRAQQSELQDLDLGTTKNLQQTSSLGLGVQCGRPNSLQTSVIVQKQQIKNSAETRKISDADNKSAALAISYGRPSLGKATLLYSYADAQFPNRALPGRPIGDGFFTETFGLGYERKFASRLKLSGVLSRTHLKREFAPSGLPLKLTSTTYAATAEYRPSRRLQVTAEAGRQVRPSQRTGKLYDIATLYSGVVRYNIGTRFTLSAGDNYERVNSNTDTASVLDVVTRSRSKTVFGGVTYRQSERASLLFDVRQEDRTTNLPSFNYTDTRVGLEAAFKF
jgi:hypothetical protein